LIKTLQKDKQANIIMMKSTKFFLFLFCLGIFSACKPTIELPNNLEDETPTFKVSADIEGRNTPVSFIVGDSRARIDLLLNRTDFMLPCTETQLGNLSFIFPSRTNSFSFSKDYPLLQSEDNSIGYKVSFSASNSYYTVLVNDTIYKLKNYNDFTYPSAPKKIAFVSKNDPAVQHIFYNPASNPPPANLSISAGAGVAVSSRGASFFKWNTGSATPLSPLDSSTTSKYYCVTVTGTNPEAHSEACGLVTKYNGGTFLIEEQNQLLSVIPELGNLSSNWMALKFTDTDGLVYRSELGKQPTESFFAIDHAEVYDTPDFTFSGGGFSSGSNRSMMRLDVRFDCVLYTPYGKQLHLKNGKGTIAVMIGF
jgi:hypothetical protein